MTAGSIGRKKPKDSKRSILASARDWSLLVDFYSKPIVFPPEILATSERPDTIIWSIKLKKVILIELTCPAEEGIANAQARKKLKYFNLVTQIELGGIWSCTLFTVEVGARGFVAHSVRRCMTSIGLSSATLRRLFVEVSEVSARCSYSIYLSAKEKAWQRHRPLLDPIPRSKLNLVVSPSLPPSFTSSTRVPTAPPVPIPPPPTPLVRLANMPNPLWTILRLMTGDGIVTPSTFLKYLQSNPRVPDLFQRDLRLVDEQHQDMSVALCAILEYYLAEGSCFGFRSRSLMVCGECKSPNDPRWEHNVTVPLAMDKEDKVEDLLRAHSRTEVLNDPNNLWSCPNGCVGSPKSTKSLLLETHPPVMILHLKRFGHDVNMKPFYKKTAVQYPMQFLIKSFFQTIPGSDDTYDLVAVALHSGPSLARGHFFCWVKNFMDNKWYVCDDSVTTPLEDVPTKCLNKSSRVYMLFYVSTILQHILLLESLTLV